MKAEEKAKELFPVQIEPLHGYDVDVNEQRREDFLKGVLFEQQQNEQKEIAHDGEQFQIPSPNVDEKIQRLADGHKDYLKPQSSEVEDTLVAFMLWYKNTVPIGTQKTATELVKDFREFTGAKSTNQDKVREAAEKVEGNFSKGFEIKVMENGYARDGVAILMLSTKDYIEYKNSKKH